MEYIGLDIGGTKCAVCIGTAEGGSVSLIDKSKFATGEYHNPYDVLDALFQCAKSLLAAHGKTFFDIAGIGISCGGPLDAAAGVILSPPNLPGWDHIEIVSYFEKRCGVRTYLQNDANACAVAEWKFGAGYDPQTQKSVDHMIFCTFGTGLGAGLILGGRLYSGASDMAGEVGHLRLVPETQDAANPLPIGYGKRGSAEGFCSGGGIAQLGRFAVGDALARGETPLLWEAAEHNPDAITAKLIGDLAERGDSLSVSIYEQCGEHLGQTLSILVDLLNPSLIVLGGVFMRAKHLLRPAMERVLAKESLSFALRACKIVPAGLGERIGDYAALSVAVGDY
ncbi:MAG: ROK family protein [Clostridia bacterium]|nr:ROK family protein [Clostridia bacterium]